MSCHPADLLSRSFHARAREACRTFTTDYTGDVSGDDGRDCSGDFAATMAQFDRDQLLARSRILMSAEVPLYESEMDDHGVAACSVRVRCPLSWLCVPAALFKPAAPTGRVVGRVRHRHLCARSQRKRPAAARRRASCRTAGSSCTASGYASTAHWYVCAKRATSGHSAFPTASSASSSIRKARSRS